MAVIRILAGLACMGLGIVMSDGIHKANVLPLAIASIASFACFGFCRWCFRQVLARLVVGILGSYVCIFSLLAAWIWMQSRSTGDSAGSWDGVAVAIVTTIMIVYLAPIVVGAGLANFLIFHKEAESV